MKALMPIFLIMTKMNNFIEALFFGNIEAQQQSITKNRELKKVWDELVTCEEELSHKLSCSEKEMFEKYVDCYAKATLINEKDAFVNGFRIGAKLTLDTFSDTDDLLYH